MFFALRAFRQNSSTSLEQIRSQARSFDGGSLLLSVYLGGHGSHPHDKMDQAFPLRFFILQVIKNWTVGRPGNETSCLTLTTEYSLTNSYQSLRASNFNILCNISVPRDRLGQLYNCTT